MGSNAPTHREFLLVALLLAFLLFFFKNNGSGDPYASLSKVADDLVSTTSEGSIPSVPSNARLSWNSGSVPQTKIISHVPGGSLLCTALLTRSYPAVRHPRAGWTLLDKMYVLNGTVYIVTDQPDIVPDRKFITSTGVDIGNSREEVQARLPTDRDMRIISPEEAKKLFGTGANRVEGLTVSVYSRSRTNIG